MLEFSDTILIYKCFIEKLNVERTFSSSMMLLAISSLRTAKSVEWSVMRLMMVMKIALTVSILWGRMAPVTANASTRKFTI